MSPIAVFAFNRLDPLKALIDSLRNNPEAKECELYVFVDGEREGNQNDVEAVNAVRHYVETIKGFKEVHYRFSAINLGLGSSIIAGVSEVINRHGSIIVLEDDLRVEPGFLRFMNQGMTAFENCMDVWSVCGYSNKVSIPENYPYDAYFSTRSSSWGWGTWANRWNSVDWSFDHWNEWKTYARRFNLWGGSDCFGMLADCRNGKNQSWAIRFCFNQFLQNKVSLFPVKSLITNDGFDGTGTNCRRWSRFKCEIMPDGITEFRLPEETTIVSKIHRSAMKYHSIPARIISRIMYTIT